MMDSDQIRNVLEACLLVAGRPMSVAQLDALFENDEDRPDRSAIREALAALAAGYEGRGIELVEVAGGWRLQTRVSMEHWVARLFVERPPRYSRALLETLVLIAYRQPITRGEIEEVRGVAVSSNIVRTLQDRRWVREVGHKDVPGKPALLGTTSEFLDYFNLKRLDDLPSLGDLQDLDGVEAVLAAELGIVEDSGEAANDGADAVHARGTNDVGGPDFADAPATFGDTETVERDEAEQGVGPEAVVEGMPDDGPVHPLHDGLLPAGAEGEGAGGAHDGLVAASADTDTTGEGGTHDGPAVPSADADTGSEGGASDDPDVPSADVEDRSVEAEAFEGPGVDGESPAVSVDATPPEAGEGASEGADGDRPGSRAVHWPVHTVVAASEADDADTLPDDERGADVVPGDEHPEASGDPDPAPDDARFGLSVGDSVDIDLSAAAIEPAPFPKTVSDDVTDLAPESRDNPEGDVEADVATGRDAGTDRTAEDEPGREPPSRPDERPADLAEAVSGGEMDDDSSDDADADARTGSVDGVPTSSEGHPDADRSDADRSRAVMASGGSALAEAVRTAPEVSARTEPLDPDGAEARFYRGIEASADEHRRELDARDAPAHRPGATRPVAEPVGRAANDDGRAREREAVYPGGRPHDAARFADPESRAVAPDAGPEDGHSNRLAVRASASGDDSPDETAPGESVSGEAAFAETGSGEAVPGEADSGEAVFAETASGEVVPGEAGSSAGAFAEIDSGEAVPGEVGSEEDAFAESVPGKVGSGEVAFADTGSGEAVSAKTGSEEGVFAEAMPGVAGPDETVSGTPSDVPSGEPVTATAEAGDGTADGGAEDGSRDAVPPDPSDGIP